MLQHIVDQLVDRARGRCVLVGVDGRCGSGKTTLARGLVASVGNAGVAAVHVSSDGFHRPRAVRYRAGRTSAEGYYRDTYDIDGLRAHVLDPLAPGGSGRYATEIFDLAADKAVDVAWRDAPASLVLVYDGSFSLRRELVDHWDVRVLVDTPREIAEERMLRRDIHLGDEALSLIRGRYHGAWDIHVAEADPYRAADVRVRPGPHVGSGSLV